MHLVIVESPTKAKKLSGYLGSDFHVEASVGHIRDLPKGNLGIDLEKNFEPTYEVNKDKKDVVSKLKRAAKKATDVVLATDPDREGEAIAWHIQYLLKDTGVTFQRATFHEITKTAVLAAMAKPEKVNQDLVDAQQARRVVDRLVGYKVSPVLWKKIRRGLSAGRVQSVALRLIAEREREIEAFEPDEYWEVDVAVSTLITDQPLQLFEEGKPIEDIPDDVLLMRVVDLNKKTYKPKRADDVNGVVATLKDKATDYQITKVEKKARKRSSLPPFTTSTLQQQAATRLGFTSKQTMRLAQQLYEEGLITYHRTDAVSLSTQALEMARGYISEKFGKEYLPDQARSFANRSKNAQEAHEAIRVTQVEVSGESLAGRGRFTERHSRLYDLIWRRFLASQMNQAIYDQTTVVVTATAQESDSAFKTANLRTTGSVMKFDGWTRLFPNREDILLPEVSEGQPVDYRDLNAAQKFTQPPPRYNDASLVKELEKRGIGRPSTYASIISVIEDRGYVERMDKRFVATAIGLTVCDFLVKHFKDIMDYDFTAEMEENLDRISRGEKVWQNVVKTFYTPLSKIIEDVTETADREQIPVEKTGVDCPTCLEKIKAGELEAADKGEVVIRTGRFGKFKSCSRYPDCNFTENIVEKLEGQVCPLCSKGDIIVKKTRWGKPFFGCGRYPDCDWASWQKPEPGLKITKALWAEMQAKREERKAKRAASLKKSGKTAKKKPAKKETKAKKKAPAKKPAAKTRKKAA